MIKFITISNLAVISHLRVEFGDGLNILSGETGAGKSIILLSFGLLLGERASVDLLRTGETKAFVEGVFEVEDNEPLHGLLAEAGIELDGEDLIIRRELQSNGRGKVFVNNQSATLHLLKSIQPHIIDVHGQGEQQSLLSQSNQGRMLDAFGKHESILQDVEASFHESTLIIKDLEAIQKSEAERLQTLDLLEFQIQEIEKISPRMDEDLELETERKKLANAEKLTRLCSEITELLYEENGSATSRIGQALKRLEDLITIDASFTSSAEQLSSTKVLLEDVVYSVRSYAEEVVFSPAGLQAAEDRLVALEKLKRKYGSSISEVVEHFEKLKARHSELKNSEITEEELRRKLGKAITKYEKFATKLTSARKSAAKELEKLLKHDLSEVALEKSRFSINFKGITGGIDLSLYLQQISSDLSVNTLNKTGQESAEYYFSANKGEEARPLSLVASGGELSRLMLVLKTNIAPTPYPRTLVFDEIDSGIGGRVAEAVGLRLKKLAKSNQVICVTHQVQIARYADCHLFVQKNVQGSRTLTTVNNLEEGQRIVELARMMGGADITDNTLKVAREMVVNQ